MAAAFSNAIYEALIGLTIGFIVDLAIIPVLVSLNSPWYVWLVLVVVIGADLVSSIIASISGGLSFAAAFILIGLVMSDLETIGLGILALLGPIGVALRRSK